MKRLISTLGLLLALTLNLSAKASVIESLEDSDIRREHYQIVDKNGVVQDVYGKHKIYIYRNVDGSKAESVDDLSKSVPDRRSPEKKHPILNKIRVVCTFVNPMIAFVGIALTI